MNQPSLSRLQASDQNDLLSAKEATMISRFIDRWFDELVAWEACIDVLATLPDNF